LTKLKYKLQVQCFKSTISGQLWSTSFWHQYAITQGKKAPAGVAWIGGGKLAVVCEQTGNIVSVDIGAATPPPTGQNEALWDAPQVHPDMLPNMKLMIRYSCEDHAQCHVSIAVHR